MKAREASAVEVVQAHLDRIAAVEGRAPTTEAYTPQPGDDETIHAYISLQAEKRNPEAATAFQKALASGALSPELQAFVERKLKQLGR